MLPLSSLCSVLCLKYWHQKMWHRLWFRTHENFFLVSHLYAFIYWLWMCCELRILSRKRGRMLTCALIILLTMKLSRWNRPVLFTHKEHAMLLTVLLIGLVHPLVVNTKWWNLTQWRLIIFVEIVSPNYNWSTFAKLDNFHASCYHFCYYILTEILFEAEQHFRENTSFIVFVFIW